MLNNIVKIHVLQMKQYETFAFSGFDPIDGGATGHARANAHAHQKKKKKTKQNKKPTEREDAKGEEYV